MNPDHTMKCSIVFELYAESVHVKMKQILKETLEHVEKQEHGPRRASMFKLGVKMVIIELIVKEQIFVDLCKLTEQTIGKSKSEVLLDLLLHIIIVDLYEKETGEKYDYEWARRRAKEMFGIDVGRPPEEGSHSE